MFLLFQVVQVYMSWLNVSTPIAPKITLVGFERPHLVVGKTITVIFTVTSEQMAVWVDDKTGFEVVPGMFIFTHILFFLMLITLNTLFLLFSNYHRWLTYVQINIITCIIFIIVSHR